MALNVEIGVKDNISAQINALEQRFSALERAAAKAGKRINLDISDNLSGLRELGDSLVQQTKLVQKLQDQQAKLLKHRSQLNAKAASVGLNSSEQALLNNINNALGNVNNRLAQEKKSLQDLQRQFSSTYSSASRDIGQVERNSRSLGLEIERTGKKTSWLREQFSKVGAAVAAAFTLRAVTDFAKKVVQVRGEMQSIEAGFATMLGSSEKAADMMRKSVEFAATTPFDLQGVASGVRQLLAFGTAQENVFEDMKMLGDVAGGLQIPLSQLIYLYGTLRAQGRVMTIDIRQFAMRGIPIYDELAKVLGVAKDKVQEMVSSGNVTFEHVEQAFKNMTSEGGKFAGLMDGVSKTINGRISNIGDNITQMFNDIGKQTDGLINTVLNIVSVAVENYKKIADVLSSIIIAYGSYKAAIIAVNVAHKAGSALFLTDAAKRLAAIKGLTTAQMRHAAVLKGISNIQKVIARHPYALILSGVVSLIAALMRWSKRMQDGTIAQEQVNKKTEEWNEINKEGEQILKDMEHIQSQDMRRKYVERLIELYPELLDKYEKEKLLLMDIAELRGLVEETQEERIAKQMKSLDEQRQRLEKEISEMQKPGLTQFVTSSGGTAAGATYTPMVTATMSLDLKNVTNQLGLLREQYPEIYDANFLIGPAKPQGVTSAAGTTVKDKEYWEKQKKSAQAAIDALTNEQITSESEEYKKAKALYDEADKALAERNKNLGKQEEKRLEARRKYLDTLKEYQDEYENLLREELNAEREHGISDKRGREKDLESERLRLEKELAKIDSAWEKEKKKIEQNERDKYEAEHGSVKGFVFDEGSSDLYGQAYQNYLKERENAEKESARKRQDINKKHDKEESQDRWDYISKWGDYEEKKAAITEKYAKRIAEAENEWQEKDLEKQRVQEMADLAKEYSAAYALIFADADSLSNGQLNEAIRATQGELKKAMDEGRLEDYADLMERLNAFQGEKDERGGPVMFGRISEGMKNLRQAREDYDKAMAGNDGQAATQALQEQEAAVGQIALGINEINSLFNTLKNTLSSISPVFGEILGTVGDIAGNVGTAITSMKEMEKEDLSFTEKLSNVGGIVGAFAGVYSTIRGMMDKLAGSLSENAENWMRLEIAARRYRRELENIAHEKALEATSNAFGDDGYSAYIANFKRAKELRKEISDMRKDTEAYATRNRDAATGAVPYVAGKDGKILTSSADILFSDQRSGWQQFWGSGKNIFAKSLSDFYDENGDLLGEELSAWYDAYGDGLSESQKSLVEDLLSSWEDYEDSLEQMGQYLESLFGDVASGIAGDMVESFLSTGDALADLSGYMNDFRKSLASSAVQSMLMEKVFTQANQDQIASLLGTGNTDEAISLFNSLIEQSERMAPEIQAFLEGLEMNTEAAQQEATAGGFETMSQDTASELNGRFTAIQISNEAIRAMTEEIRQYVMNFSPMISRQSMIMEDIRQIQANSLLELMSINDNTNSIIKPIKQISTMVTNINDKVARL